jgi:hypothetical protein
VGDRCGTFFIERDKNDMFQWMINLPDEDLADVRAVQWEQDHPLAKASG